MYSSIGVENESIIVSNELENTISIFNLEGEIIGKFGTQGKHYGEFNSPRALMVNDQKIYISDPYNYRIQIFDMKFK